jgi:hypothetical protein
MTDDKKPPHLAPTTARPNPLLKPEYVVLEGETPRAHEDEETGALAFGSAVFSGGVKVNPHGQVMPGGYTVLDADGKPIGALWCESVDSKTNNEYYGMKAFVGGTMVPNNTVVAKIQWTTDAFRSFSAFKQYCADKGYTVHILASCRTGGW